MEIYAVLGGIGFVVIAIAVAYFKGRSSGRTSAAKDVQDATIDEMERVSETNREVDREVSDLSDTDLDKRLLDNARRQ